MLFRRRKPGGSPPSRQSTSVAVWREARLPVHLLQPGMRLTGLDRDWEEVPVLLQGFVIREQADIRTLRKYCRWVLVEGEAGLVEHALRQLEASEAAGHQALPQRHSVAKELPRAASAYDASKTFIEDVFKDIRDGKDPEFEAARPIVRNFIASVNANAYALFWLTRVKDQDAYTAEHCLRVSVFAISFARFLGMDEQEQEIVGLAGLLHDIGKIKTPDHILNKPGRLTDAEFEIMKQHPVEGYRMLCEREDAHPEVKHVTLHHHERLDGHGYPDGLTAANISRYARLVSIVDVYDAITSSRVYKEAMPANFATNILYKGRGTQFDSEMVEAFIRMVGVYPVGSIVELSTNDVALVSAVSPNRKLQPQVEVVLDARGNEVAPYILDLAEEPVADDGAVVHIKRPLPDGEYGDQLIKRIQALIALRGAVA